MEILKETVTNQAFPFRTKQMPDTDTLNLRS